MESPTEIPIFLSTLRMELMVPPNRLIQLNLMDQWRSKQASTNHQLLSFIGELAHATKIVKPGKTVVDVPLLRI